MEPQVEIYCKKECKNKDCSCLWLILAIVLIVIAFFAGVLVGALTEIVATLGVGAIAVLIIALGILGIIAIINLFCCKSNKRKNIC